MHFEQLYAQVDVETTRALQSFRREYPPRQLQLEGANWQYISGGQGTKAILFLHGMAGAYDIWWQQIEALRESYRFVSVTYPPLPVLEALCRGLASILTHEGLTKTNVVGSSLGGYVAQCLVARFPDRIEKAVFANTFPPNEQLARRTRLAGKVLPFLPERAIMSVLRYSIERAIYPASGHSELVRAYLLEQSYGLMSKAQFVTRYQCVVEPYSPPDPQALGIPTLLVQADNDPLVEKTLRDMLKETYPSAAVHTFHDAGHFPYLNQPEAYSRLVQEFLVDNG